MCSDRKNVHLSGGVGIGGVLEPLQANPTIIEDNCFIGARSEIEGVIVEEGAVISMGVYIGQSTRFMTEKNRRSIMAESCGLCCCGQFTSKDGKLQPLLCRDREKLTQKRVEKLVLMNC